MSKKVLSDLSKVKIGDNLYNYTRNEWAVIKDINKLERYPIKLCFLSKEYTTIDYQGNEYDNYKNPTWFWNVPKIEIPPPPKRMVEKEIKFWVWVCEDSYFVTTDSKKADYWIARCRRVEEITKKIEVEE